MYQSIKRDDITSGLQIYACDFETTTGSFANDYTKVWSFALDRVGEFRPEIYGSIADFWKFCGDPETGTEKRLYFHNLKFDGEFILYSAINEMGFTTALDDSTGSMRKARNLIEKEIVYAIADTGQWYFIAFIYKGCRVEIRDSLKILPLTLEQIGKNICSHYKKSTMNYDDKTSLDDCTPADIDYIKNDVLVLSEALDKLLVLHGEETPFGAVHSLTIGGACWQRFKQSNYGENKNIAIHLDKTELDKALAGSETMDEYIRKGYRGGYCYVDETKQGITIDKIGFVADVNSLYPYVMCYKYSGFVYPYGKGIYQQGEVPEKMLDNDSYYFYARIIVSFRIKPGYVPTVQKKNTYMFLSNQYLTDSRIYDSKTGKHIGEYQKIELTLAKDDYILFFRHYEILSFEALDYISFMTGSGICDEYIENLAKIKIEATETGNKGVRTISKLFQNNLYGQFAKGDNSSFKLATLDPETQALTYEFIEEHNKKVNNIAIGAAITAHARYYQISTIQNNRDIFCYSDTDSLHCIGAPIRFHGEIDKSKYGAYDIEHIWYRARFVRQKTYIEELEDGSYNICCAGMTQKQKDYFASHYDFEAFKPGLTIVGGKLQPQRVRGGVILKEVDFTIK